MQTGIKEFYRCPFCLRPQGVIAIDVDSGKQRWAAPFPPQAATTHDRKEDGPFGMGLGRRVLADDVSLSVDGPVLVVRWSVTFESRLALADGHLLATRRLKGKAPKGRSAGVKEETTIAFTPTALENAIARGYTLLSAEWIGRWDRSHAKFPAELAPEEQPAFADLIRGHAQFRWNRQS